MQRQTPNENNITIPPNLLKNFNVYDILEPQKNGANASDGLRVDKLIDIDDSSRDSGFQDSELGASFLDSKKDFTLVDLFQNIFVTPQHIKKKETNNDTANTAVFKEYDVDFKNFLDVLESGQKIDWANVEQLKKRTPDHNIEEKPRVLVPKVFMEPDSDPEDLISEVLMQKNLEKRVLGDVTDSSKEHLNNPAKVKYPEVLPEFSRLNLNNDLRENSKLDDAPRLSNIKPSSVENQINNSLANFTVRTMQKDEKVFKKKRIITPENLKANYTKGPNFHEKSVVLPQIMARMEARQLYLNEKDNQKKRLVLDAGTKTAQNGETSKEQPKPTVNNQTNPVTKQAKPAPIRTSKEPQLCINSVTKIIAVHSTDKPCKNCIVPSTSKSTGKTSDFGKLSPNVLMADCNKERLKALKQSQMFKDFVLKGKSFN